jgi:hypothetical protein
MKSFVYLFPGPFLYGRFERIIAATTDAIPTRVPLLAERLFGRVVALGGYLRRHQ